MKKARRVNFKQKIILNDGFVIEKKLFSRNFEDDENTYFTFFDNSYVALYNSKSKFVTKIKTDELESLIENGRIDVIS